MYTSSPSLFSFVYIFLFRRKNVTSWRIHWLFSHWLFLILVIEIVGVTSKGLCEWLSACFQRFYVSDCESRLDVYCEGCFERFCARDYEPASKRVLVRDCGAASKGFVWEIVALFLRGLCEKLWFPESVSFDNNHDTPSTSWNTWRWVYGAFIFHQWVVCKLQQ